MNHKTICYEISKERHDFVGLSFQEDTISINFPIGYNIPSEENEVKKSILDFIEVISLTKKISATSFGQMESKVEIPLDSYVWFIKDYLINGIYQNQTIKTIQSSTGKINWKKTLKTKPYFSNETIFYLNPFVEKKRFEKNILTEIYEYCLGISTKEAGWLFHIKPMPYKEKSYIDYYLQVLMAELSCSYQDYKKELIEHCIRILKQETKAFSSTMPREYGTKEFEYAWEKMINKIYGNIDIRLISQESIYHLENEVIKMPSIKPDAIRKEKDELFVLDAKYYKYGISKNKKDLPGTYSINKQIMYGKYLKSNDNVVYSAFLLPFHSENEPICYIGYAENEETTMLKEEYEKIAILLIDTNYVIECYLQKREIEVEELIQNIKWSIRK